MQLVRMNRIDAMKNGSLNRDKMINMLAYEYKAALELLSDAELLREYSYAYITTKEEMEEFFQNVGNYVEEDYTEIEPYGPFTKP